MLTVGCGMPAIPSSEASPVFLRSNGHIPETLTIFGALKRAGHRPLSSAIVITQLLTRLQVAHSTEAYWLISDNGLQVGFTQMAQESGDATFVIWHFHEIKVFMLAHLQAVHVRILQQPSIFDGEIHTEKNFWPGDSFCCHQMFAHLWIFKCL